MVHLFTVVLFTLIDLLLTPSQNSNCPVIAYNSELQDCKNLAFSICLSGAQGAVVMPYSHHIVQTVIQTTSNENFRE